MELTPMNQGINKEATEETSMRKVVVGAPVTVNHEEVSPRYRSAAITPGGGVREAVRVDMGLGGAAVNNVLQFDVINTAVGAI